MSGLKSTEIMLSHVKGSDIFRLDSFYYSRDFIDGENRILQLDHKKLIDISDSVRSFGAYSLNNYIDYLPDGIPFIRGVDLQDGMIDLSNTLYISPEAHKLLWKSEIHEGDLLVTMSGTIGRTAIAMPSYRYPLNSNQDIAKIRLSEKINTYYVYAFFLSKYGQDFLIREARGSVQQHVFLSQMEQLIIPIFSEAFQAKVEQTVLSAHEIWVKSKLLYEKAENLLSSDLGFKNKQLSQDNISLRSSADVNRNERWDAEYYQPKYDEIIDLLKSVPNERLGKIVTIQKSIEPGSKAYQDTGIPFLRVQNLTVLGFKETEICLDPIEFRYAPRIKQNSILLTKDGSVGIAYKAETDLEVITSGAILHLYLLNQDIDPNYLTLILNSQVVKLQAERDTGGSIIQHWKPSEIEEVVIPVLPTEQQVHIGSTIRESFSLRRQSRTQLKAAKRAVEIAIEQGEQKAFDYLRFVERQNELHLPEDAFSLVAESKNIDYD